ncbi:MAG: DsbA family protein [Xanthobacteraceae bacterium]|nr:DsbA family protein [Xanthobacteraceae bacterium]
MFSLSKLRTGTAGWLAAAALIAGLAVAAPLQAAPLSKADREAIEAVIKDYLLQNPEVLRDALMELEKRANAEESGKRAEALKKNQKLIFESARGVVVGNPKGDITIVEFFDYNCGYCKRALADMLDLIKADPKLKFVLKEFPVLGPGSLEAAKVAIAVRMQDKDGAKYLAFHRALLGSRGEANRERALAVAKEAGADMARLEKDLASAEINATIEESVKLAEALGIGGTPSYVIANEIVPGAIGFNGLKNKLDAVRKCGRATC